MEIRGDVRPASIATLALLSSTISLALPARPQPETRPAAKSQAKAGPGQQKPGLAAFLAAPIDIAAFKRKKGPSNNGAFKASHWFYRPGKPGFYYQYMLFNSPSRYSEGDRFAGFSLVVYKAGKTVGDFYDTNETLAAIWCRLNDPDLGQANLVGTPADDIKTRFGEPFTVIKDVWVYQRDGRAVSLYMNGGMVVWFKYARLSRNIAAPEAVPALLLHPGPGW